MIKRDPDIEARLAELREFEEGFKLSKKGNFWRTWEGKVLTVFKRGHQWFWCIKYEDDHLQYSRRGYEDEDQAVSALAYELLIGG